MSIIINLFGGPGSGKSTLASELFSVMKKRAYSVELTQEFPKVLAWDGNIESIKDQFYVTANQHRNISRLYGKVDYIIVDSPILLGLVYKNMYDSFSNYPSEFYDESYDNFIISLFKKYKNINIYLKRLENTYENVGRYQDYEESLSIDKKIKELLLVNNLPFNEFNVDYNIANEVLNHIRNQKL
jgi:GTPase SAR1 family protein